MKKRKILAAVLALALVVVFAGCSAKNELICATGGESGTYYTFGSVLAETISDKTSTNVRCKTSSGSQVNLENIASGKYELGLTQCDVMNYAYTGTRLFSDEGALTNFSVIAVLYNEAIQIVTCDPSITSVADLKGKTVSIGESGSGVYYNAIDILDAYDIKETDISPIYESFADAVDELADGKIDAAFIVAGTPTSAVSHLTESSQIYLVPLDEEHIATMRESSPYYDSYTIAAGTYDGVDEDVMTVSVHAVLVASDDVSDDDVYNIVSAIYDNLDEITEKDSHAENLSLDMAVCSESVPYHPGAAKYYEEQGYTVATK